MMNKRVWMLVLLSVLLFALMIWRLAELQL